MRKAVWVLVLLNVAALAWAYMVVQREPAGRAGAVTLWRLEPASIIRVESRDAERIVTMRPETDGDSGRRILWITVRAAQADAPGAAFQGNEIARRLLENLATLKARRRLDGLDAQRLADYGLTAPAHTVVLTRKSGEERRIQAGRATFGGALRYVRIDDGRNDDGRKAGDAPVYLLPNPILARFSAPRRLLDRTVLPRERRAAGRLRLQWQGQTMELWRTEGPEGEGWAKAPGGVPLPAAKAVVDALAGLAVAEYVAPRRVGTGDAPRLAVAFFGDAAAAAPAHWLRVHGEAGEPLLVSSYTQHPVLAVHAGVATLLKRVAALFAAE